MEQGIDFPLLVFGFLFEFLFGFGGDVFAFSDELLMVEIIHPVLDIRTHTVYNFGWYVFDPVYIGCGIFLTHTQIVSNSFGANLGAIIK